MGKDDHTKDGNELLATLEKRFEGNKKRHSGISWSDVRKKLEKSTKKLKSLQAMEDSGGEPDVVGFNKKEGSYIFFDCSPESPKGRRSLCYDRDAWESRKKHKPESDAQTVAAEMGIELLTEEEYFHLQSLGNFDTKTSSWLKTPADVRKHGGAIFGDYRFGRVFVYHNGAESYYGARGFRGSLKI